MAPRARAGRPDRQRPDLRLAIGAGVGWLCLTWVLGGSATRAWWIAAGLAAAGSLGLVAGRRGIRFGPLLAVAGFCGLLLVAPLAGRLTAARASALTQLARANTAVTAELTVTADPRLLAAKGAAGAPRSAMDAQLNSADVAGKRVDAHGAVLVLGPAALWRDVLPGQRLRLDGQLRPPLKDGLLQAVLVVQTEPTLIGSPPWWQRAAAVVRTDLRNAAAGLPAQSAGLLPGIVDGDRSTLDPVLAERFRTAGLTHLVAVSGAHCAIVLGGVLLALGKARAGPRVRAVVGVVVLIGFVIIARPSPSVLRAAGLAAIALYALAAGRERQMVPALSAAVLGLLIWQPQLATQPGFAMSVLATAALLLIAPGWTEALTRRRVPAVLAGPIATAAAAHLATAPVIAALSGSVSLVAVPANILAEPAFAPTMLFGFLAALVAPFLMSGGHLLAAIAGVPCGWLVRVAEFFGGLDGATMPWPGGLTGGLALLAVTAALVLLANRAGIRPVLGTAAVAALIVQIPVRSVVLGWPPPGWFFAACDVGQGDALVLKSSAHAAVVVDAGPDAVAVDRCLSGLGVTEVPLLVLSHYHLDHVGGIQGVLHGRKVGAVVTGPLPEPATGYGIVRAGLAASGKIVGEVAVGTSQRIGGLQLDFLGPAKAYHGTRSDPNNSSVIIRATVAGRRVLLTGDAEVEAQHAMLTAGIDLDADVLKVPHHGSAYSDPKFLAAVHAKAAVVSVAAHNTYGLPSPTLLAELDQLGLPVDRTDREGDVAFVDSAGQLSVVTRGRGASTVAAGVIGTGGSGVPVASGAHATMGACQPMSTPSRPPASRAPLKYHRSFFCSATRSCSSTAVSSA